MLPGARIQKKIMKKILILRPPIPIFEGVFGYMGIASGVAGFSKKYSMSLSLKARILKIWSNKSRRAT